MRPSSPYAPTLPAVQAVGDPAAAARHSGMATSLPAPPEAAARWCAGYIRGSFQVPIASFPWCSLQGCLCSGLAARAENETSARRGSVSQLVRRGSRKASVAAGALLKQLQVSSVKETCCIRELVSFLFVSRHCRSRATMFR